MSQTSAAAPVASGLLSHGAPGISVVRDGVDPAMRPSAAADVPLECRRNGRGQCACPPERCFAGDA